MTNNSAKIQELERRIKQLETRIRDFHIILASVLEQNGGRIAIPSNLIEKMGKDYFISSHWDSTSNQFVFELKRRKEIKNESKRNIRGSHVY